jgi:hypothetical protein
VPAPVVIFDTGFLYSLAVDQAYADALRDAWSDRTLWIPPSAADEITFRQRVPLASLPPGLPNRAKGLIQSSRWHFEVLELTEDEAAAAEDLRERIGDPDPNKNRAECEAAAILVARQPDAAIRLDDTNCLRVIGAYVQQETGQPLDHATTTVVLDLLVDNGHLTAKARDAIRTNLHRNGRPFC